MLDNFITPESLLYSAIIMAMINLLTPWIGRREGAAHSGLLILVSLVFFLNVLLIDGVFFQNIKISIKIPIYKKYFIGFYIESLGLIFLNLVSFLWICSLAYTIKFLAINKIRSSRRFLFFMNCSIISTIFVALSSNLFTMFVFYELLTLSTLPLIAHSGGSKVLSGMKNYLKMLMLPAGLLFLPAMMMIYSKFGHGDFMSQGFVSDVLSEQQTTLLLVMFIFGISKTAIFPLHNWLPQAMVAIYPVSALLHAVVVVKTGLFCIYKILIYVFGLKYLYSIFAGSNYLLYIPIITIIYSSFKALQTDNIKNILAYSTINQLNIALLSAFMFTSKAMGAAILHLVSHSFTKICLFYGMGNIYSLTKASKLQDLSCISSKLPKTSLIILIASFSLIGIPPFAGFFSKFYIILASSEENQYLIMVTLLISTISSALYLFKINSYLYKVPPVALAEHTEEKLPILMLISLTLCGLCVVLFAILQSYAKDFLFFIA